MSTQPEPAQDVTPFALSDLEAMRAAHVRLERTVTFKWVNTGETGTRVEFDCAADCPEGWPCPTARLLATLDEATAAARAEVARQVRELPGNYDQNRFVRRAAVLALLEEPHGD